MKPSDEYQRIDPTFTFTMSHYNYSVTVSGSAEDAPAVRDLFRGFLLGCTFHPKTVDDMLGAE